MQQITLQLLVGQNKYIYKVQSQLQIQPHMVEHNHIITESQNKPDPPPPSHCLLDEDVVEDNEQDPRPLDTSFPTPCNGIIHQKKEPEPLDELEVRHVIHLPGTFPIQPLFTCPAQGKTRGNLIIEQSQEGTFLEEELKDI